MDLLIFIFESVLNVKFLFNLYMSMKEYLKKELNCTKFSKWALNGLTFKFNIFIFLIRIKDK